MARSAPRARAAWRSPRFVFFEASRLAATIAMQACTVSIGWQIYEVTRSPLYLGYVGLAQFLPSVVLALLSGHVADRFDRRRIVALTFLGAGLTASGLFWQTLAGVHVPVIFLAAMLLGTGRAFTGPASQALLSHLVPVEHFANAVAWHTFIFQVGMFAGPALAGAAYAALGPLVCFGGAALLYLLAAVLLVRVDAPPGGKEIRAITMHTVLEGVRYVWRERILFAAMSLDLFAVLLGGAVALMPIFARDILGAGPVGLGVLRAAPALGAMLGALYLAQRPFLRRVGQTMLLCVAGFGAATIVFGLSQVLWLSIAALVVVGATDVVSVTIRQMLVQLSTPDRMRGRVSAVASIFIGASNELGEFESGLTAAWWGPVRAVVVGGVGTLAVVLAWSRLFPELRAADTIRAVEEPRPTATPG